MPTSPATIFVCSNCEAQFPKWQGRCTECGKWGTIAEHALKKDAKSVNSAPSAKTTPLTQFSVNTVSRIKTGIEEFDRVLGGGIVPSSLVLVGGEPGIGKSTLILQIAAKIGKKVLYVSGEESGSQIKMRFDRLNLNGDNISIVNETHLETVCSTIAEAMPELAIIDSIQTVYSDMVPSEPGSVSQVKAATVKLLETAKQSRTAIFIIGHITKEGVVAGPKTLEHLVDTVIYLEGDRYHMHRILRTIKNRFGSTNEVGIFEMASTGLMEVKNPSAMFLEEKTVPASGSVVAATVEGTRVFLAEVQALVSKTSFGYPQRKTQGFDLNRLNVLVAVLQRRAGIHLDGYDIYVNIAGGLKISEPACDLAVCLAIVSSKKNIVLDTRTAALGEVGLSGEVRMVNLLEKRVLEAEKLGFKKIIVPKNKVNVSTSCEIITIQTLSEAIEKTLK